MLLFVLIVEVSFFVSILSGIRTEDFFQKTEEAVLILSGCALSSGGFL